MSFVRNIFGSSDNKDDIEDDEGTSSLSDQGFFSPVDSKSDLEVALNVSNSGSTKADCSSISSFFGYWKNLINQETKFQSELNDLTKHMSVRDEEVNKLKFQLEELQRDVFAKSAGMDRLDSELNAAHKECDMIRQKLRHLEEDLVAYRTRNSQLIEELAQKEENLNECKQETKGRLSKLVSTIKGLREKINLLEEQLIQLKEERSKLEKRHTEQIAERDEESKKAARTLEHANKQKQDIENKWQIEFEQFRTINILKEQQLLEDFEWKLREVQKTCKTQLDNKEQEVRESLQKVQQEEQERIREAGYVGEKLENLRSYEQEVLQLRSRTVDQGKAIKELREQHELLKDAELSLKNETRNLKKLIEMEKENLQHINRCHQQEIADKERKLQQTLAEKRTEIAMYWEEKLLHECARLKSELEQIHNEEKWMATESVRKLKDEQFQKARDDWECKLRDCLNEVARLKKELIEKDEYYHEELIRKQTVTDQDILGLRRLMEKIDMTHHEKYEKLVLDHEYEIDRINEEHGNKIKEVEHYWQSQVSTLHNNLEIAKEQMERESQLKIETLIQQHRSELDGQWNNLLRQKREAIKLLEEEYVLKYMTLEEQLYTQQKSHTSREVELLKTIDSLKNEIESRDSAIHHLQSNVDTLEGGVQVLNQEIFQHNEELKENRREADQKIKGLLESLANLQENQEKDKESYRLKLMSSQRQSQETIDHLQKKCQCLTKLFEEVRQRYERRESRQEDLNTISDLRQVIAEQEKDLACINEEKRFFQVKLIALEKHLLDSASVEDEDFEDAQTQPEKKWDPDNAATISTPPNKYIFPPQNGSFAIWIPSTIPEGDE